VVVVVTDNQGYGDVGCFGAPYIDTPNLDRMATEGAKLTSFYVSQSICTPSRASILTGRYPARVGLDDGVLWPGSKTGLDPAEPTVADLLSERGYATTCIGKWHLGDNERFLPTNHGFDSYFGVPYSPDMGAAETDGEYRELPLLRDTDTVEAPVDLSTVTRRYTEEAVEFIETHRDGPFFCYLPHTAPHTPLRVGDRFRNTSERGRYGDVIGELDWSVGRVLDTLDRLGIGEETLVVFTTDHGPWSQKGVDGGNAGPLRGGIWSVLEGGLRVPTIARWPGEIPAGTVCSELLTAMDLLPTVANLAGTEPPADRVIDGEDITGLLRNPTTADTPHEYFFYHGGDGTLGAVRDAAGWKLHLESEELYHLHTDVEEAYDVAGEHPDTVERLRSRAAAFADDIEANSRPPGRVE
jgi:arylsulfatase A-like enzyme